MPWYVYYNDIIICSNNIFIFQAIGGPDRLFYHLELGAPGSWNDSSVWRQSEVKKSLESRQPRYRLAGDSAYPRSVMLVTPFSNEEGENDLRKRLFNLRHAGLRAECTENIFGMWKRRFPIIRNLRNHFDNALEIVMATAVLHNLAVLWNEEEPDESDEDGDKDGDISDVKMYLGGAETGDLSCGKLLEPDSILN